MGMLCTNPNQTRGEGEVQIGDVGYIDFGRFMRFANVFTSEHGIPTVDEKHRAIIKLAKLDKGGHVVEECAQRKGRI